MYYMFFNKPVMFSNFSKQNYGFNANWQKRCDNKERREKILAGITHSKKSFGNLKTEKKTPQKKHTTLRVPLCSHRSLTAD